MNRYSISLSILFIAITVIAIKFYYSSENNMRAKYESFILESAKDFDQKLSSVKTEHKAADQPDMAAFQEFISTVDPNLGYVPESRLMEAYKQTHQIISAQKFDRNYTPIIEWETSGSNMGGRTRALMFDPNDDDNNKVWAGGVTGGLWYINDITSPIAQWQTVNDFWPNLAVSCITYDPNNTQTMYVGTGEAQTARLIYRKSSGLGAGIYKTNDGGESWELMPSTEDFAYVTDIVVRDEDDLSVIYAAVVSGTYMGEDHESQPSDGLYRSVDSGENWDQVLPIIPNSIDDNPFAPSDIEISTNGRIFVGTMENLNQNGGACILYSETGLEGSWTIMDDFNIAISDESYYKIPARTIIAVAPSDPNRVYAQFAAGYDNGFTYYRGRVMAMSDDAGVNWSQISSPPTNQWSTLAWHAFILQVDPNNKNLVYTGGLDLWNSSDAGQSWRHVSDWYLMNSGGGDNYVHADQHSIQFSPNNDNTAVFSSDGGVFYSQTTQLNYPIFMERNRGLSTLQFYSCAIDPTPGSNNYIGGLQDNGTLLHEGGPLDINDMIKGGDGAFCFWDRNEPEVYITSIYYNKYYSYYNGNQQSSLDAGTGTFICPADYDYKLNTIYANGVQFFGGNANKISRIVGVPFNMSHQLINIGTSSSVPFSHIKYSEFSTDESTTIFVGTQAGILYKVEDANSSPNTTEIGSPDFPLANLSCIALGMSEDTILVTFSNYGVSSVWQTYNGGESWQEKEGNLPDMPIRWALYHPSNSGQALLATETGIWATNTLKEEETEWSPAVDEMANVRVDMLQLRYADNTVLAATHGRGLFTAEYNMDIYTGQDEITLASEIEIYPNPASDIINFRTNINNSAAFEIKIFDMNGRLIKEIQSVHNNYTLNVSTYKSGTYIAVIKLGDKSLRKQTFIVK